MFYRAYKSWELGVSKGMAWEGLEKVFLEYEERFSDKKEKI